MCIQYTNTRQQGLQVSVTETTSEPRVQRVKGRQRYLIGGRGHNSLAEERTCHNERSELKCLKYS